MPVTLSAFALCGTLSKILVNWSSGNTDLLLSLLTSTPLVYAVIASSIGKVLYMYIFVLLDSVYNIS